MGSPATAGDPIIGRERTMTTSSTRLPTEARQSVALRPEELRGRASGVTVCAVMGLTWAGSALGSLSAVVAVPLLAVGVGCFALLMPAPS